MDAHTIEQLIRDHLPGADVQVQSADGVHFQARVVSSRFAGMAMLKRHRMVHDALGEALGGDIHALSITALTPDQA